MLRTRSGSFKFTLTNANDVKETIKRAKGPIQFTPLQEPHSVVARLDENSNDVAWFFARSTYPVQILESNKSITLVMWGKPARHGCWTELSK